MALTAWSKEHNPVPRSPAAGLCAPLRFLSHFLPSLLLGIKHIHAHAGGFVSLPQRAHLPTPTWHVLARPWSSMSARGCRSERTPLQSGWEQGGLSWARMRLLACAHWGSCTSLHRAMFVIVPNGTIRRPCAIARGHASSSRALRTPRVL